MKSSEPSAVGTGSAGVLYSPASFGFWRAYWVTMRPYLLFVSGAAGMVGFAAGPVSGNVAALAAFLAFFLSYGFGQALTDCFQMDTDSISSPYRPLVRGLISRLQVLVVSLIGLLACCGVLFLLNPLTLAPGLLCVLGLATYTWFKRRWWAGPLYNGWIVALLPVIGTTAASGRGVLPSYTPVTLAIVLSVFFSYANFVLMGYFKDISADRASGYNTFVVVYGWAKAAVASDVLAAASILASGYALHGVLFSTPPAGAWLAVPILLCAGVILAAAQVGIHRVRDERAAHGPIASVVRAFVLLHCAEICVLRPAWVVAGAVFYVAFELTLRTRPEQSQV